MADLCQLPIHRLHALMDKGEANPRALVDELLARIARLNPTLHVYIAVDADRLRAQVEARLSRGPRGRLFGIPITIKDNLCLEGEETTCGSKILRGFRPPYSATVIERLVQEGAIIVPRARVRLPTCMRSARRPTARRAKARRRPAEPRSTSTTSSTSCSGRMTMGQSGAAWASPRPR